MNRVKPPIIISLGGSCLVPDGIDARFLKRFKDLILAQTKNGERFIIVSGGGRTARRYQEAGKAVATLSADDRDWLGIHATRLNAHLLRTIFRTLAEPAIIKDPTGPLRFRKKILIAAGWKPGWSTDYIAVKLAERFSSRQLVNISNISHVFEKDPRRFPKARAYDRLNWREFRRLIPPTWDPGLSSPFDPVASRLAEKLGLSVAIVGGDNFTAIRHCLAGQSFDGTLIESVPRRSKKS